MKTLVTKHVSILLASSALALAGNQKSESVLNRPEDVEARIPIHVRPALSSSPYGYAPSVIRHAYGFDQLASTGSGQIIAIVDAYGSSTIQNDLNVFSAKYGLPTTTVKIYYPQGVPRRSDSGWALETSLDVEWAHAIAPNATIALVVAKSTNMSDLLSAVDYAVGLGAKQISMSWGGNEFSSESYYDYHFNRAGVTFTASSGDNGAGVMWPAASPYVIGVGGTTLRVDSNNDVVSEAGWSGSGGGVSSYEARPSWQAGWQSASHRAVPDVSYDGDPNTGFSVYVSNYNGSTGWAMVGGTSAGAPQWAALMALVNSARSSSLTSVLSNIYSIAAQSYSTQFDDVLSGSNGAFAAAGGYDLVTGLGSPLANMLVPALQAR